MTRPKPPKAPRYRWPKPPKYIWAKFFSDGTDVFFRDPGWLTPPMHRYRLAAPPKRVKAGRGRKSRGYKNRQQWP